MVTMSAYSGTWAPGPWWGSIMSLPGLSHGMPEALAYLTAELFDMDSFEVAP